MTTYASGRPAATKLQAQVERMFRSQMQAKRWPQELSDNEAGKKLSRSFGPELSSKFCSDRALHKNPAAAKTGLNLQTNHA